MIDLVMTPTTKDVVSHSDAILIKMWNDLFYSTLSALLRFYHAVKCEMSWQAAVPWLQQSHVSFSKYKVTFSQNSLLGNRAPANCNGIQVLSGASFNTAHLAVRRGTAFEIFALLVKQKTARSSGRELLALVGLES